MKRVTMLILFSLFCNAIIFVLGCYLGSDWERRKIAEAIRAGRLTVMQRVDSIADQIEAGPQSYIPSGGKR